MEIDMSKPNYYMVKDLKEYEVHIYHTYDDESEETYGVMDELHVFDTLEEAFECYNTTEAILHKQLMHYPERDEAGNLCADSYGDVIAQS